MLIHPTFEKLRVLGLHGMAQALEEQRQLPEIGTLTFEERLGLLVDREATVRESRRLKTRLRQAALRHSGACIEDIDYRSTRGLDKALMTRLATGQWVREHHNLLIVGPTGIGKSWVASALAQAICRAGLSARYWRLPKLFQELATARGDGRYAKRMREITRTDLLVLDDLGVAPLQDGERQELLEILEERYDRGSTLVTSQYPVEHWHELIGHPTLADAVLDRLVHNAYRLTLSGESMRKRRKPLTLTEPCGS